MRIDKPIEETPLEYALRIRNGISNKAEKNKNLSTQLFVTILFATVFSPLLILLTTDIWISKYIPAFVTACAALASYWLQLRKPQERWVIYRTAQREIEFEIDQYCHENGDYSNTETKDKLLSDRVSKRALQLHYEWIPVVPKVEDIEKTAKKGGK